MRYGLIALLALATSAAMAGDLAPGRAIAEGKARIRYLGHAGWLVRTSQHALVFDYTGAIGGGSLAQGTLSAEALAGQSVLLFVTHAHGDHYNRRVLDLRDSVENLTVVMGWKDAAAGPAVVPADGEWTEVSGAEVLALHHEFDGIPEGFFVVRSGGVVIYHSGDHATWSEPPGDVFRTHIDRLAQAAASIDIAFLSAFGKRGSREGLNQGDVYGIRALKPRVTFPMHCGGCEDRYALFASEAAALDLPTTVALAEKPGDCFVYADGKVRAADDSRFDPATPMEDIRR